MLVNVFNIILKRRFTCVSSPGDPMVTMAFASGTSPAIDRMADPRAMTDEQRRRFVLSAEIIYRAKQVRILDEKLVLEKSLRCFPDQ